MVNLSNQNTLYPIHYSLGESSERVIIHQQDDLCITHEHLYQDATPTRFYQQQANTFCFVLKGELYLQQKQEETILKKHQGIWLNAHIVNTATLLSPIVELCLIRFKISDNSTPISPIKKVSSGTVESGLGRNHIKTWPLWQSSSGSISLELYPPRYIETLYYQKAATQYILSLDGMALISDREKHSKKCDNLGKVIPHKVPRAILNPSSESIIVLSVTTSHKTKGRVLLLKKTEPSLS
ncbi:hypothetical protein [Marinomonas colpomeniae]|uniref:Uncharacterized protein n=1 Tax=Marinomonas colpomeniae TaxID=2774408 RepID=A0ABR8NVY4_9GAMM|nr:hypothetical protein [Marinomonas colpomeniae]MBD5770221.1 hypothetical protein [Marinomonas colpomeniae]